MPGFLRGHRKEGASQVALVGKDSPADGGDLRDSGSIPGSGRSPGRGNPLQYSCLQNPMDRGAWRATVHRITESHARRKGAFQEGRCVLSPSGHIPGMQAVESEPVGTDAVLQRLGVLGWVAEPLCLSTLWGWYEDRADRIKLLTQTSPVGSGGGAGEVCGGQSTARENPLQTTESLAPREADGGEGQRVPRLDLAREGEGPHAPGRKASWEGS